MPDATRGSPAITREGMGMSFAQHVLRVGALMIATAGLLTWMSARTEVVFADGLRYIHQAMVIDQGDLLNGLLGSIDHPSYPLTIALAHRAIGGEGPVAWQRAAQAASILAGILLVVPLYLVALELFGPRSAWLGCALVLLTPIWPRIFADALSEGTFLLFWLWGFWAALRFLKRGTFGWLPLMIGFNALAYLTRPEALLLPLTMVATLIAMPVLPWTRLNWPRWAAAMGFLVIGPACIAGPFMVAKGGIGTKPAIARLIGTAPESPPDAVERSRPLDPNQSVAETYQRAIKATFESLRDAVTVPLLVLAAFGLWLGWPQEPRGRIWLFLSVLAVAGVAGLVRLHATGGYCTPRHAMILAIPLILAAAAGLDRLLRAVSFPGRWIGETGAIRPGPAVWALAVIAYAAWTFPALAEPLNSPYRGYRLAAEWLDQQADAEGPVVDATGWSLFYASRHGYTFSNLHLALGDPEARYVVARENHLYGPWGYCKILLSLVEGREPLAVFPEEEAEEEHSRASARVYVFDRHAPPTLTQGEPPTARR